MRANGVRRVIGDLAIAYIFLGGTGAGALLVAALFDLFAVRTPFGLASPMGLYDACPVERQVGLAVSIGLVSLAVGCACLAFDLGRINMLPSLFFNPTSSLMSLGTYSLAATLLFGGVVAAVRVLYLPWIPRSAVVAVEWALAVCAAVSMSYTGFLLGSLVGVAFWRAWCVPALFILSSLSCGLATMMLSGALVERDFATYRIVRLAWKADVVVLVLEFVAALSFMAVSAASGHPGVRQSAGLLFSGELALLWWGFLLGGIAAPFTLEVVSLVRKKAVPALVVLAATLILVGGLCLRVGVCEAGTHRPLELQAVEASAERAAPEGLSGPQDSTISEDIHEGEDGQSQSPLFQISSNAERAPHDAI